MKFLAKIAVQYEKVDDGVQCTDKVFANPHGHYSIILVWQLIDPYCVSGTNE